MQEGVARVLPGMAAHTQSEHGALHVAKNKTTNTLSDFVSRTVAAVRNVRVEGEEMDEFLHITTNLNAHSYHYLQEKNCATQQSVPPPHVRVAAKN